MKRKSNHRLEAACVVSLVVLSLVTSASFGQRFPVSEDALRSLIYADRFWDTASNGTIEMQKPYIGVNLFLLPVIAVAGPTRDAFKWGQTFFTVMAVLAAYAAARALFSRRTAFLSGVILAFMPTFVMMRWDEQPFLAFGLMAALALFLDFRKNGRSASLCAASVLSGACAYVKLTSLYFFAAVLFSYAVLIVSGKVKKPLLSVRAVGLAAVFFLLGASPLLWHNAKSGWDTASLVEGGSVGASWRFLDVLLVRPGQLLMAVEGYEGSYPFSHLFQPLLWLGAGVFLLATAVAVAGRKPADLFLVVSLACFTFLLAFLPPPSPPRALHLYHMLPFAAMLMAGFFAKLSEHRKAAGLALLVAMLSLNLANIATASARLSDQSWIEENFARMSSVHYGFSVFLQNGDTLLMPGIRMIEMNANYIEINGIILQREAVCQGSNLNGRSVAECNMTKMKEVIEANEAGRLVFVCVPLERKSYAIYEEDCMGPESVCYRPLLAVREAAEELGKRLQKIGSVNDSKGDEAYSVYLIV